MSKDHSKIQWDRAKLDRLKSALSNCTDDNPFEFEGFVYLPSYARYLVEYLETRFVKG